MANFRVVCLALFLGCSSWVASFEKLDPKYVISYGDENAPIQVTEYFSFSCPTCLMSIREDFSTIKKKYIDTNQISWVFHPDPSDLLTMQAMVCLEKLNNRQKRLFLQALVMNLEEKRSPRNCLVLQEAMKVLSQPLENLSDMQFLEKTEAFSSAFRFLKQKDVVTALPTVEINGKIYEEYPSLKFLKKKIDHLIGESSHAAH